jgi:hypothetical protein
MASKTPIKNQPVSAIKPKVNPEISVSIAARLLGFSVRWVQALCDNGTFATAHKPGFGRKAHWRINRNEVLKRKFNYDLNRDI